MTLRQLEVRLLAVANPEEGLPLFGGRGTSSHSCLMRTIIVGTVFDMPLCLINIQLSFFIFWCFVLPNVLNTSLHVSPVK